MINTLLKGIEYKYYRNRICKTFKIKNKSMRVDSMKSIKDGQGFRKLSEYRTNKELKMPIS